MFSFLKKNYRHPLAIFVKKVFGFLPGNILLYELALTHKSASVYQNKDYSINNERLEFLGDAVLNTIIGEYLFLEYVNENEGFLTNLRSKVVNRQRLNEIAKQIEIQKVIKLHHDLPESCSSNIYGNALEALIGAIFLDKGYKYAQKAILQKIIKPYVDWDLLIQNDTNYKGKIIDWAQKNRCRIEFKCESAVFQNNQQGYLAELFINEKILGKGMGITKKEAEQQASKDALSNIPQEPII